MPGIEEALGKKPQEELDEEVESDAPENNEENPLEKMDKISKAKPDGSKSKDTSLDEDTIKTLFMTGDNTTGMFTPDKKKDDKDEDEKPEVDIKTSKVKPLGKYENDFKNDLLKHPEQYTVETPMGQMTVKEAMNKGYDPITKTFNKDETAKGIRERNLKGLNDADRKRLEDFTDPRSAKVPEKDAGMYGLNPDSPMIARDDAEAPRVPMQNGEPQEPKGMPTEGPTPPKGDMNLEALLGGAK